MNFQAYMMALNPDAASAVRSTYGNPYSQIDPHAYSGMGRDENPGDKLYADLVRAQTQDYLNRFAPVEDELVNSITPTGTTALPGDLERTREFCTRRWNECSGSAKTALWSV